MPQPAHESIKAKARELGFLDCAVVPPGILAEEKTCLTRWTEEGMHGTMDYMARNMDKRLDPRLLVEGARTLIIVLHNYYSPEQPADSEAPVISRYARGKDYHQVIKKKLGELLRFIQTEITPCHGRAFTDSAPILERAWARRAGLGWIGKNSMLISPQHGSYFFIGELIIDAEIPTDQTVRPQARPVNPPGQMIPGASPDPASFSGISPEDPAQDPAQDPAGIPASVSGNSSGNISAGIKAVIPSGADVRNSSGEERNQLPPDQMASLNNLRDNADFMTTEQLNAQDPLPPATDRCGTCTRCIDACPTRAIIIPRIIDARRCISYQTIELRGDQNPALTPLFQNRLFGCDICQEVCPWNRKATPHHEPDYQPLPGLLQLTRHDWDQMTEEQFNDRFRESPLRRTGYAGIRRTLNNLQ